MNLILLDIGIIFGYIVLILFFGFWVFKWAFQDMQVYFLGGNKIFWYFLGFFNVFGMFDILGMMWMVIIFFVYGLKSVWILWFWLVWNQVFVMVFLAIWFRCLGVFIGVQWIIFWFGDQIGGCLFYVIVIVFVVISVFGFIVYFFEGIGKFVVIFFFWDLFIDQGVI